MNYQLFIGTKNHFLGNPNVLRSISMGIPAASCVNVDDDGQRWKQSFIKKWVVSSRFHTT